MLHCPTLKKTVLDKTSRGRVNSASNTTTSCRRSAYVHIKKGYIGKDHCTLWNTFVVSSSVLAAAEDGRLASLLKVAVHLEAVVTRVGHRHVAVGREGQALGTIKGVRWCVNVGQEGPGAVEYLVCIRDERIAYEPCTFKIISQQSARCSFSEANLDPAVAPIGNNDISIGIDSHACRGIELSVPLSVGAEFKQELPVSIVHLVQRLNRKQKGRTAVG